MVTTHATVQNLYDVPDKGKAEIVHGELVPMSPTGIRPGRAGGKVFASLLRYEEEHGGGYAIPDNVGFVVHLPGRDSFSPDAAWHIGDADSMKFGEGAPRFAVEVRSENDYRPPAERAIRQKITDYFTAGTWVVWDIDLLGDDVLKVYRASQPDVPVIYRRGDLAEAEPAVPGWSFPVNSLFR